MKKVFELAMVVWSDAEAGIGWYDENELKESVKETATPVVSVSFLYSRPTKEVPYCILFADLDPVNESNNRRMLIPQAWIKDIKILGKYKYDEKKQRLTKIR